MHGNHQRVTYCGKYHQKSTIQSPLLGLGHHFQTDPHDPHETLEDRDTLGFVVWSWWRKADADHKMPAANPFLSGRKQEEPVLVGGLEHFVFPFIGKNHPN